MIKKINFLKLLFCILFVSFIKLSSSFEIIVDPSNNTPGSSTSIPDALNNFKNYLKTQSIKNYTLELKLVEGTYEADLNGFTYFGWDLIISPFRLGSKNVIIDGTKLMNSLITINNDAEYNGLRNTFLTASNINFRNFNTTLLSSSSTIKNDQSVKVKFDQCQFSKCFKGFTISLSADSTKNVNSIIISNTNFENVSFLSSLFKFRNFNVQIISSEFNTISGGGEFVYLIDSSLTIDSSQFKEFIVLSDFITTNNNGEILINNSEFINFKLFETIITTNTKYLINIYSNNQPATISKNTFTNIDIGFIKFSKSNVTLISNTIANSNWKFIAFSFFYSNVILNSNTINYSNNNNSLVSCSSSNVEFNDNIGDSISHEPICTLCNFIYNGNKFCSISTSTTTIIGTTSTTTGEHTNGSINIKPVSSYQLFFILLLLITLFSF
ncbi:hypothetical protein ACTFIZ_001888 [Dictyostelium cf. discoideum]